MTQPHAAVVANSSNESGGFRSVAFFRNHQVGQMKNPWLKKNPFMSMWLSGANTVLNSARGRATAEAKRQAAGMMAEGNRQMVRLWTGAMAGSAGKNKRSR
jgi:hypothetical protein